MLGGLTILCLGIIQSLAHANIPGISQEDFDKHAQEAKANCPVSKALSATDIALEASLL